MRWEVSDFKGLKRAQLNLSPGVMSVLTGVNSSGKSSVLQSLLLTAQSQYHDGPMVLNGPLVRLGAASDLLRKSASRSSAQIALEFLTIGEAPLSLRAEIDLIPKGDDSALEVDQLAITQSLESNPSPLLLNKIYSRTSDVDLIREALSGTSATDFLHLKSSMNSEKRTLRTYVGLRGMVPVSLVQLLKPSDISREYVKAITPILAQISSDAGTSGSRTPSFDTSVGQVIQEFVQLVEAGMADASDELSPLLPGILLARNGNPYRFEISWRKITDGQRLEVIELAALVRSRTPYIHVAVSIPASLRSGRRPDPNGLLEGRLRTTLAASFSALRALSRELVTLADRVQYLGPLRDEPRVVWNQWNELARGLPVGTRGEFSAIVLSRALKHDIVYTTSRGQIKHGSLGEAVNDWVAYLEIGQSVTAQNLGKLGIGLQVKVSGEQRDLTAVGVGVSQALPLVVAVLATPPKSIFIVEQPELHLHPAVQSRLADFLMTARPDITTLVETHSEALVTRVRRRVAEGKLSPDRVSITFVELEVGGSTSRELGISEYGDLSDWPDGFLSGIGEDTSAIVQANLRRLKAARE